MTLKNNRVPLLWNIKLCASFHRHLWIRTGVTIRKRLSWFVTSVTLTFDLWHWSFSWTSILSLVITPENFMIIWSKHSEKGVTDRQTDRRTDWAIHRAAWLQLKMKDIYHIFMIVFLFSRKHGYIMSDKHRYTTYSYCAIDCFTLFPSFKSFWHNTVHFAFGYCYTECYINYSLDWCFNGQL